MKTKFKSIFFTSLLAVGALNSNYAFSKETESDFPTKTVNIIVPYGAGGAADILTRTLGEKLSKYWGQPVVVENRPGGVGTIGINHVVKAKPDGYTLVTAPVSDLAVNPHLYKNRSFNVNTDLAPVSQIGAVPNVLVISSKLDINDVNELVEFAKNKGQVLSYGSPGVGSQAHIAAEIFEQKHQLDFQHIPYNGVSNAMTDVIGGHIDLMFVQLPTAMPFFKDDNIKVLGVAAQNRTPLLPDMNTLQEVTGENYGDAISWSALMAPKDTPLEIREKIAKSIAHIIKTTDFKEKLASLGMEAVGSDPETLQAAINRDSAHYQAIIEEMSISLE